MVDIVTDASVKPASHPKPLRVGLDIGSTTVKAVVLDQSDSLKDTYFPITDVTMPMCVPPLPACSRTSIRSSWN